MSPLRRHQAELLARALFWLAIVVGLSVAFGDSLGRAVLWIVVAVALGLLVQNRREIAARIARARPRRRP